MKKESIRDAADRITQYLRITKEQPVETLHSVFGSLSTQVFFGAIGWLLREGTVIIDGSNISLCADPECNHPFYF